MIEINKILDVEKYIDDVDAVIFDLDDTLYSEKEYVRSGYQKIAIFFQIPEIEEQMWQVFLQGGKAIDEVLNAHDLIEQKTTALRIYREQKPAIHLYTGIQGLLERVRQKKKIGIITDGRPEGQRAKINALGLDKMIDQIIITDELGGIDFRKPNSASFQLMRDIFDVPFEKMLYVGDNPRKDFIAPEQLGMKSLFFVNPDGLYSQNL